MIILSILTEGYIRIILAIVVLIVLLIILTRFRRSKNPAKDSLEILKERYENGEISKGEYEEAKQRRGK